MLALAGSWACRPNTDGALRIVVELDPAVRADCGELVVSAGDSRLAFVDFALSSGTTEQIVGAKQGALPGDVVLRVDAFTGECAKTTERRLSARSANVTARFPRSGVQEVRLVVGKPDATLDADGDGFVAAAKGGADCLDSDPLVNPKGVQACGSSIDGDCDGKLFCDDPGCAGEVACQAPATGLALTPESLAVLQGACIDALTLEARRDGGVAPVDRPRFIALTASGVPVDFFSDAQCATATTTAPLDFGASTAALHFVLKGAGTATLTASDSDTDRPLGSATATVAAASHALTLTGVPAQLLAGSCSGAVTVSLVDGKNQPWVHAAAEAVAVAAQGVAGAKVSFFASGDCSGAPLTTLAASVPAGSSTLTLSFSGTLVGAASLVASDSGQGARADTTFGPGVPAKLALLDAASTVVAGACESPVTIEVRDAFDNASPVSSDLTVTLGSLQAARPPRFFSDSCNTTAATVVVPARAATVPFGFSPVSAPGPLTVTGTAGALTGSKAYTVATGAPAAIAFKTPPPAALARYTCTSTPVVVELRDGSGNPVPAPADTTLTLGAGPGMRFFAVGTPGCGTAPVTAVTLLLGQSQVAFALAAFGAATTPATVQVSSASYGQVSAPVALSDGAGSYALTAPASEAAGGCDAVAVSRRSASLGAVTFQAVDVTVSSGGAGLTTHTDAACSSASPAVVRLNAGASSGTVYVRGRSADSVATTLTASDALNDYAPGTASTVALPLVRRGTCTILQAASTATCPITPALTAADKPRSFLVFQAAPSYWTPTDAETECHLDATPQVVCSRAGTNNAVAITATWQVVTFGRDAASGGATVQTISGAGNTATPMVWTISAVDPTRTFVLGSHGAAGNNIGNDDTPSFKLSSATTVTLSPTSNLSTTQATVGFQVVELSGASVQRGSFASQTGSSFSATLGTAIVPSRTFPLYSVRLDPASDNDNLCQRRLRSWVSDATHLSFHRGGDAAVAACAANNVEELDWEAVQLPSGATVQQVELSMASGGLSATGTIAPVALHRTVALLPGQAYGGQAAGESDYVAVGSAVTAGQGDNLGVIHAVLTFPSSTQLKADRGWGGPTNEAANAHFTAQVIQFAP